MSICWPCTNKKPSAPTSASASSSHPSPSSSSSSSSLGSLSIDWQTSILVGSQEIENRQMEAGGEGERVGERLEEKLGKLENTSTLQKIIQISHEIGKSTRAIGDKL